jgi:hypothetical protein
MNEDAFMGQNQMMNRWEWLTEDFSQGNGDEMVDFKKEFGAATAAPGSDFLSLAFLP